MPKFKVGPVAESVPFNNAGEKFLAEDTAAALIELRSTEVHSIEKHTTTLNGSDIITASDTTIHIAEGTATGYSFVLPDATTLFLGRRFELVNESTETITVKDDGGTVLASLISGDIVSATLENNSTSDGVWVLIITSSSATGVISYSVGSDTTFTTTSSTDVLITGMTVTPVTGRYAVWFSSDIEISQNNRLADVVLYKGGTEIPRTRREVQGVSSNFKAAFTTIGEISVNGSEALDVRVLISSGSLDVNQRRLILIRLGQ